MKPETDHNFGGDAESGIEDETESAIYSGFVRHRRFEPRIHEFDYPLFMMLLKVDEIDQLTKKFWQFGMSRFSWARFRRADYIGKETTSIAQSVREKLAELSNQNEGDFQGDVFMLCHLRYFGLYFSPLNLYFLRQDGHYTFMLAEVSNTPWNERHYYLVRLEDDFEHDKEFHVSPFNPIEQSYRWRVQAPDQSLPRCLAHIESWQAIDETLDTSDQSASPNEKKKIFDATLSLQRVQLNQQALTRVLLRTPIQTFSIVVGIYWQALKLFIKKVPMYKHPRSGKKQDKIGVAQELGDSN